MRGLTESMMRFGWALSVFGVQQALHLAAPRKGWDEATRQLDTVSHAAERELGETLASYYRAGERFQNGFVDSLSRMMGGSWSEPGKQMNRIWEGLDRARSSVDEVFSSDSEEDA